MINTAFESMNEQPAQAGEVPDSPRRRQVEAWCKRVRQAKAHHEKAFERMREDMKFARGLQWPGQTKLEDPRYVVNMVQRHLRQREAALYAKNPKAIAHRRRTLDFAMWDGDPQTLMQAQQTLMMAQQMQAMAMQTGAMPPGAEQMMAQVQEATALLEDYQGGMARRRQLDQMAKTLEIVWDHQVGEQQPPFKLSMKQLVRRTLTTGVGYQKLGYHRFEEFRPEDVQRVTDLSEQIAALQALLADETGEHAERDDTRAELAELEDLLARVTGEREAFVREGLDFDYPRSTSIIPDPECRELVGFVGARWVAQEFLLTPDQVHQVYGVELDDQFTPYDPGGKQLPLEALEEDGERRKAECRAVVWEIWDKHHAQTLTVCEGHHEFLIAPKVPDVRLEQFWPFFPLVFNGLEDEEELFPPSDVRLMRHPQIETNLMRQRLREHRDAARPGHVSPKGRMTVDDKQQLENRRAHQVIEISGMADQDDIRRLLQPIPVNPIDPNQYDVAGLHDDIFKTMGTQEAVMGGQSNATATETSIAESARLSSVGSAVDDLDDHLTTLAKAASQLLLVELAPERAAEIAGPGAVWPQLTASEVAQDLWLVVRAGSSGRPNKSAELQNIERMLPYLMQVPGVKPLWVLEQIVERLDDRIDPADAYDPMLPAMTAMNANAEPSRGPADEDPNAQGAEGGNQTAVAQGDSNLGPREAPEARVMDPNRR